NQCASGNIFGPCAFNNGGAQWPKATDLAGKVIAYAFGPGTQPVNSGLVFWGTPLGMTWNPGVDLFNRCSSFGEVQSVLAHGPYILRLDQYQAEWTFQLSVAPPNPIVVDWAAPAMTA